MNLLLSFFKTQLYSIWFHDFTFCVNLGFEFKYTSQSGLETCARKITRMHLKTFQTNDTSKCNYPEADFNWPPNVLNVVLFQCDVAWTKGSHVVIEINAQATLDCDGSLSLQAIVIHRHISAIALCVITVDCRTNLLLQFYVWCLSLIQSGAW